eukprot:TRINITY_DN8084_c0_g1_i1.p1 TRINITY_DN8084_c0_g1~~TRINITY_DN8084_c0_g1_i1.p1  ORF type:complete len:140 (-),score=31.29 TRINITY_DN8084_c0_g1_i1:14-433(-)
MNKEQTKEEPGAIEQIFASIFTPGAPPIVLNIINFSLLGLIAFILLMLTVGGWHKYDWAIHVYIFLGLAFGLWCSIQFFLSSLLEAAEKARNEENKQDDKKKDDKQTKDASGSAAGSESSNVKESPKTEGATKRKRRLS